MPHRPLFAGRRSLMQPLALWSHNIVKSVCKASRQQMEHTARRITSFLLGAIQISPIRLSTSIPSTTRPNTTCLPSHIGAAANVKKNCEVLLFFPASQTII